MELKATSLPEYFIALQEIITEANKANKGNNIKFFYRGHFNKDWKLVPSILRKEEHAARENYYIDDLTRSFPTEFTGETEFGKLVKCQHYELPTRLLDITSNAITALFFAVNPDPKIRVNKATCAFKKSCKGNYACAYKDHCDNNDACVYIFPIEESLIMHPTTDLDKDIAHLTEHGGDPNEKTTDFQTIDCIEPRLNNPRINRQQGAFFLFKDTYNKDVNLDPKAPYKIIIPQDFKKAILKDLEAYGINEVFFFPELTTATTYLKNKSMEKDDENDENKKDKIRYVSLPLF